MKPAHLIAARLSREGYGTFRDILKSPADQVIDMLTHSQFSADYERTFAELNKGEK